MPSSSKLPVNNIANDDMSSTGSVHSVNSAVSSSTANSLQDIELAEKARVDTIGD